jgi:hypothetical protein
VPRDTTVRQRVVDYLIEHGPVEDASGRTTSQLKEAVGYTGGDAGFIRIVSLMAEAGEVVREVRGKRTYRIAVSAENAAAGRQSSSRPAPARGGADSAERGELDYDELAAALLARVAGTLLAAQAEEDRGSVDQAAWARRRIDQLEGKVSALQRDLARARADVQAVAQEREALRSQLDAATHNVDVLTERLGTRPKVPDRAADRLDSDAQALLYRLRGSGPRRRSEPPQAEVASSP